MTNTKDSTVDLSHLYPELLFVPSERYEKFYRDLLVAQKANKHDDALDEFGSFLPINANFGITEK